MTTRSASVLAVALAVLATGATALFPACAGWLELDREAVAAGQVWRLFTGHFVHWTDAHAAWDVGTFALLGWAALLVARQRVAAALALAVLSIGVSFWWFEPALRTYRGLSGIDCALGALVASALVRDAWQRRCGPELGFALGVGAFLAGKIAWELATGGMLFVPSMGPGVVAVPSAHAAGALAGAVAGVARSGRPTGVGASTRVGAVASTPGRPHPAG